MTPVQQVSSSLHRVICAYIEVEHLLKWHALPQGEMLRRRSRQRDKFAERIRKALC